jgi:hypothetical protein
MFTKNVYSFALIYSELPGGFEFQLGLPCTVYNSERALNSKHRMAVPSVLQPVRSYLRKTHGYLRWSAGDGPPVDRCLRQLPRVLFGWKRHVGWISLSTFFQ